MSDITLRKADLGDCDDLFSWRNDSGTRLASLSSEPVTMEVHQKWFSGSLNNPGRSIYIAMNGNEKVGMVRFDRLNPIFAEISVNLAPDKRGKGFGAKLITLGGEAYCSENGRQIILARIKKDNLASQRSFLKAGFLETISYKDCGQNETMLMAKEYV